MEVLLLISEFLIAPLAQHLFVIKAIQKLYMAKTKHQNLFGKPQNDKKQKKKEK